MNIALISAIEGDNNNLNDDNGIVYGGKRLFEQEAILCFENWRKNGGWLKDIPIYVYCPTHNTITQKTKEKFNDLGVIYTEKYHPITETFTSGFINIPFVGMLYEQELDEDIFIKIDLDMNLIRPLPKDLVYSECVVCGQYDKDSIFDRVVMNSDKCFDTGFIISRKSSNFYKLFFDETMKIINGQFDEEWEKVKSATGEYFIEEYIMDKIYVNEMMPIKGLQKYQIGEQYTSVGEYTDEELKFVYFWHEHLMYDKNMYNRVKEKLLYKKWELRNNE